MKTLPEKELLRPETIDEYLMRGGKVTVCQEINQKNKKMVRRHRNNADYKSYDYSNTDVR